jgi:hypothetical protein
VSFVLEALKKQEANDNPEAAAVLAVAGMQQRRYRLWVGLAIAAMVVNVGAVAWLIGSPWLAEATATDTAIGVAAVDVAAANVSAADAGAIRADPGTAEPVAVAEPAPAPASSTVTAAAAQPPAPAPAAIVAPVPQPDVQRQPPRTRRMALQDLPADVRRRFPGIAFSTHIYAEDRDLRAIVANGQRLSEGDTIRGLRIEEISETGVMLSFEDYLVDVPMITDWDEP